MCSLRRWEYGCDGIDGIAEWTGGLPSELCRKLSIESGAKLVAYASEDGIVLKPIANSPDQDFAERLDEAREWAASVGYQESDLDDIIKEVRKRKRP